MCTHSSGLVILLMDPVKLVWLAPSNKLIRNLQSQPIPISPRLIKLTARLDNLQSVTIICVYAPTMTHTNKTKEQLYSQLAETIQSVVNVTKSLSLEISTPALAGTSQLGAMFLASLAVGR